MKPTLVRKGFVMASPKNRISFFGSPSFLIVSCLTLLLVASGVAAQVQFSGPIKYSVGKVPGTVAVGDFNRDGRLDLAVLNTGSGSVSILLGNGDGTFQSALTYNTVNASPAFVAVGDLNGDGKLDLVVANGSANTVSVLLGNGNGTFQLPVEHSVGIPADYVAIADFNGDKKFDLLASCGSSLSILLGKGDASFQPALITSVPVESRVSAPVAIADFNRDGHTDIALAEASPDAEHIGGDVIILLGKGDGTFQPAAKFPIADLLGASNVVTGDFNRDGKSDLAVSAATGIFIMLGKGDGTFSLAPNPQNPGHGGYGFEESSLALADLNGDGKSDLIALNRNFGLQPSYSDIEWGLGNGDGTFQGPPGNVNPCVQSSACLGLSYFSYGSLAVGDFNGDGHPDLAVTTSAENTVSIFLHAGVAPTVAVSTPANNSAVGSPVNIQASASPTPGQTISGWWVYVDGAGIYSAGPTNTINANIAMALGTHVIVVRAWDTSGAYGSQTLTVTVSSKPAVEVSAPATGSNVTSPINIQASAIASSGRAITGWWVYLDSVGVYHAGSVGAINASVTASAGAHTLLVRAWDSSGAYGDQTLTVTVSSKPAVEVSAPATGSNVTSPIKIKASAIASSGRAITGWWVYLDSVGVYHAGAVGSINASVTASAGTHKLLVRAWDSSGAYGDQTLSVQVPTQTHYTISATIPAGGPAKAVAVNEATDKTYVAGGNTVTVIDGRTNSTSTVAAVGNAVAVNEATNKIYVVNRSQCPLHCQNWGYTTVIDGATKSATIITDPNAKIPVALAVNPVTNKIYVANSFSHNVTVIDGATNSTTTVTDPNAAGFQPASVAVNTVTNKIYVANTSSYDDPQPTGGNVTVIDGVTNATTTITDPNAVNPRAVAVNPVTNKIYVANMGLYPANNGSITVIDGATNSTTTLNDPDTFLPGGKGSGVAVNSVTNTIYVTNINTLSLNFNGGVTVIDGATNSVRHLTDPNAFFPFAVTVNQLTNQIYVVNEGEQIEAAGSNPGSITVIDGATNAITNLVDPNAVSPQAVAVDSATGKTYVANVTSQNVTVIDGGPH